MGFQSLTRDEILSLLRAAKAKRERDWLMILVAFVHGLRATEVVGGWLVSKENGKTWYPGLTPANFSRTHLTVRRLKGSLRTIHPLHSDENPLLDERKGVFEYLRKTPRNQRLFKLSRVRFWQLVQEYGKAAGIDKHKRHPHVLKHSIAMQVITAAGVENLREYLGHKSMQSTGEYLRVTQEAAAARVQDALKHLKV